MKRNFVAAALLFLSTMMISAVCAADSAGNVADFIASAHARANSYREMAGLPPYEQDPQLNDAAAQHAHYLIANRITGASIVLKDKQIHIALAQRDQPEHVEKSDKPFYSNAGAAIAYDAIIMSAHQLNITGTQFIDQIASMPITGLYGLLYPQLTKLGIGGYCNDSQCSIVFVFNPGLEKAQFLKIYEGEQHDLMWNGGGLMPLSVERLKSPVMFPPDGSTVSLTTYAGTDTPNALNGCGYSAPSGPGISLQLGKGDGEGGWIHVSDYSLSRDGVNLESCLISSERLGLKPREIRAGWQILYNWGAVVLIPREPLKPGHYQVSITADSKPYNWSFTVAPPGANAVTTTAAR